MSAPKLTPRLGSPFGTCQAEEKWVSPSRLSGADHPGPRLSITGTWEYKRGKERGRELLTLKERTGLNTYLT